MISTFYTASTAATQSQMGIDVSANNIANSATYAYKPSTTTFSDLLYTNMQGGNQDLQMGHGTKLSKADIVFTVGTPRPTSRNLDFCLTESNSFFAIQTPEGIKYTREGNFHISNENGQQYLTDGAGGYVLNQNNQRIIVDQKAVDTTGNNLGIGMFSFANLGGLKQDGNNAFLPTANSGAAQAAPRAKVQKGYLEASATNMAQEMTTTMQMQRAFQFNAKMVQVSDEVMQTINNLR